MHSLSQITTALHAASNSTHLQGMQRFGIDATHAIGVSVPQLRAMAKKIKTNHARALELWATGIHEARILASMIDDPALVTRKQMDEWVKDFNSWDVCDQVCGNLFDRTPHVAWAVKKYSTSSKEFIKRTAFTLMAEYAVHGKAAANEEFISFLPIIEREAQDSRNFVSKATNWALRGIGKRNKVLHSHAVGTAKAILRQDSKAAKWVASNALKELESEAVRRKLDI